MVTNTAERLRLAESKVAQIVNTNDTDIKAALLAADMADLCAELNDALKEWKEASNMFLVEAQRVHTFNPPI